MKPINVMLFLSWTGLLLFFTWLPFAESSEIMRKTVYSCMLNKSFTMNVIVESN